MAVLVLVHDSNEARAWARAVKLREIGLIIREGVERPKECQETRDAETAVTGGPGSLGTK
jgi:hypothetical protein